MKKENRRAISIPVLLHRDGGAVDAHYPGVALHGINLARLTEAARATTEYPPGYPLRSYDYHSPDADTERLRFVLTFMNENSRPGFGKISLHGDGLGAPTPELIEKRARELALIAERDPNDFNDGDWDQAQRELMGVATHSAPEETRENAELIDDWDVVPGSTGERAPRAGVDDDETVGQQLVSDGLDEAAHDQMVEARKEELSHEG